MLLQGFFARADSIPFSQVILSGNKEYMNSNNLPSQQFYVIIT